MADPIYLAKLKIPMTEKPETAWTPNMQATYNDIFNLQNTIRIILQNFVEEAPVDGVKYVRQNGKWVPA